jgi:hypothetical protein
MIKKGRLERADPDVLLVRARGVEPPRANAHMDLNHARLPFRHARMLRFRARTYTSTKGHTGTERKSKASRLLALWNGNA